MDLTPFHYEIAAQSFTGHLSLAEFSSAKRELATGFAPASQRGVAVVGPTQGGLPIEAACKKIPLITMIWREGTTSLLVYDGAFQRLDETRRVVADLSPNFSGLRPEAAGQRAFEPSWLDVFVAKHRDGLDLRAVCN